MDGDASHPVSAARMTHLEQGVNDDQVVVKAGVPVDGDLTALGMTVADGALAVNTLTNTLYVRSAGAWVASGGGGTVSSVFTRTGAVTATSGDYTAAQVTNAADKSSGSQQAFTAELKTPDLAASGLTGATAASRYVGATTSGAPASGTFAVGDFIVGQKGHIHICVTAGTPGVWVVAGSTVQQISQTAHGFTVGQAVRNNGTIYVLSKADVAADADVAGLVCAVVDANAFMLQSAGYLAGLSGLTAGSDYFLDPVTAGAMTVTEPSTAGQVSKPLLLADSTTSGWILNLRGLVIPAAAQTRMLVKLLDDATALTVQEDLFQHVVTSDLNGLSLTGVIFTVTTTPAGTIPQLAVRKNAATEMLTTNATIDLGELTSETAATPVAINGANAGVATGDVIHVDCDAAGTGAKGAEITLVFS